MALFFLHCLYGPTQGNNNNLQLAIAFWLVYPTPWQNIAGITGPTVHFCTNFYFILTAARTSFCHLLVGELQVVPTRTGWFFNCPVVMAKLPFLLLWAAMQCFLCLGYNHSVFLQIDRHSWFHHHQHVDCFFLSTIKVFSHISW